MSKSPEATAARQAIDAIVSAHVAGKVDQTAVDWVYSKAYEVFRKEASEMAEYDLQRERLMRGARW